MRAYEVGDGREMLKNMHSRQSRIERGTSKTRIPEYEELPDNVIDGARLILHDGVLYARIGDVNFPLAGAPVAAPPPQEWLNWSPTLVASPAVNMGNSDRIGRYSVSPDGTVSFTAIIIFGSTFSSNTSGNWSLTLPVAPNVSDGLEWHVGLYVVSSSVLGGAGEGGGYGKIEDGTVTRMFVRRNDTTATNPERLGGDSGFVAGNKLVVSGHYEKA